MADVPAEQATVRALLGRGSVYSLARFAQLAGMLVTLPLITRVLDADEFGRASIALVVAQVIQLLAGAGLPSAVTRRYFEPGGDDAAQRLVASTIIFSALAAGAAIVLVPVWSSPLGVDSTATAIVIAVAVVPLAALNSGQALLRAKDLARTFASAALISSIGAQVCGLLAAFLGERTATEYLIGVTVGYTAAATLAVSRAGVRCAPPSRIELGSALRFGVPTIAHSVAMYVLNAGDRVVIQHISGVDEVARYQVMYVIAGLSPLLLNSLNNAWSPLVYGGPESTRWVRLRTTSGVVHVLAALGVSGLAFAAPVAVRLLFPANLLSDDLGIVCALIAGAGVPYATFIAYSLVLFQEKRTISLASITVLAATGNIGMNLWFLPMFGLKGAALATLVAYVALGSAVRAVAGRTADLPAVQRGEYLAIGAAAVAVIVAAALPVTIGWLVVRCACGLAIGIALLSVARHKFRMS